MFPILTISGAPFARGQQYGQAAATLIRHSIASYARLFAYRRGLDWATIQAAALDYVPLLADAAAESLEEIRGIAAGAGCAFAEIVALNARTELMAGKRAIAAHPDYAAAMQRNRAAGVPQHADEPVALVAAGGDHGECTTLAALPQATAANETLLAQTWDWTGDQRAACVLLRIDAPGHPHVLTLTEAGIVAKIGLNAAGVGVSLNILSSAADGKIPGMPVHILLRRLLETSSVAEAINEAQRVPNGASSCITVADAAGHAVSLECTPSTVGIVPPHDGLLVHTNHCMDDSTRPGESELPPFTSTWPRYERAGERLASMKGEISRDGLMAILRDHDGGVNAICRHPDTALHPCERTESVTGVVLDLAAATMYVAPDVPCAVAFHPITLEK